MSRVVDNLTTVRQRMADAARRSGRAPGLVTLVAVTKYVADDVVLQLIAAGCCDLAESRPQALWQRCDMLNNRRARSTSPLPEVRWHLIGHLQRNKVDRTLPLASLIHSADSLRLLQAIDRAANDQHRSAAVLLEVNVSGDASKHGYEPMELLRQIASIAALPNVAVRGLMCMAAREGDLEVARRNFASLRELRDRLQKELPQNVSLGELSMGMSGDYEVAIEEGATMVRIGSALFEGVGDD
jgi:pyridoxal phosphate enzyme (YggS family)